MIEAVIFDFDGVIGDTMPDNCIAWQKAFEQYGCHVVPGDYYRLEGMGRYQIADFFIKSFGLEDSLREEIVRFKEQYYKEHNTFSVFEGVTEIFSFLKSSSKAIAVVTGASKARINEHLPEGLKAFISVIVTADDVTHTKPHAEPYLKAVKYLNLSPSNCVVIENAVLGIQSARNAGCLCFALETTLPKSDLLMADEVFATHAELLERLERMW